MSKFKGTKGEFELKYVSGVCIGIGTVGNFSQITANSILPETDEEYALEKLEIKSNMKLYADASTTITECDLMPSELLKMNKELLENLKHSNELLKVIISNATKPQIARNNELITRTTL